MDDLDRAPSRHALADELCGRPRQRREAQGVVRIVFAALAVDTGPIEEAGDVDDDEVHLRREATVEDRSLEGALSEREAQRRESPREEKALLLERPEPRHDDRHRVSERPQSLG
jgi:hypothetical protein